MAEAYKLDDLQEQHNLNQQEETPKVGYNKHKRAKLPKFYKIVYTLCSASLILVACILIGMENNLTALTSKIAKQEKAISEQKVDIKELQQEESELSRVDRIMKIAQKAGLKMDNNNIRTVEK